MRAVFGLALCCAGFATPVAADDWEIVGECPGKSNWCLAMRQRPDCAENARDLVFAFVGGPGAAAGLGIRRDDIIAENIYDIHLDGYLVASVACMGTLQTFAGHIERFEPFIADGGGD